MWKVFRWLCPVVPPETGGEPVSGHVSAPTMLRLQEALVVVNSLLPAPITLPDVVASQDATRKLVRAQTLARTYYTCQRNIECLTEHQKLATNAALLPVIQEHIANATRLQDTCTAALLQMYMSVTNVDASTDDIVEQAIQMASETSIVMSDVAVLEHALGVGAAPPADSALLRAPEPVLDVRATDPPVVWAEPTPAAAEAPPAARSAPARVPLGE
ncbi:tegument protein UL51 [Beluga whale alphaherpesvirus 1]|uniref:Tegument protein UL51 n=1 Tax=Beluga whale alphaherpesvirus 1 TaxID=1434720 RepID=A0A286RUI3_9ALPH|nr:tegument protein UL51 [Beluga whale alphaherpesvirus 1]ASW27054.1 tegument protein UL51 [Beluga whale alphaherpesvirus 1]